MSNTTPFDSNQSGFTPPDPNMPGNMSGPAASGSPATPKTPPTQGPTGAQATPDLEADAEEQEKKPGFLSGLLGNLVAEWQQDRAMKRELKRAKVTAQQALEQDLTKDTGETSDPEQSEELLQQERNKRIRMISEFTDVKETFDHKIKRWISSIACAVIPWLLVIFLTSDVGEYFAGKPFDMKDWKIVGIYGMTALLEVAVAVVTNAWGNTVHDANATDQAADKSKMRDRAKSQALAWGILSAVSGFALFMFLMQQNADNLAIANHTLTVDQLAEGAHAVVDYSMSATMINVVLRVIGTLAIDPACVFAVHQTTKNLDQFLKQQAQVTLAITQISDAFDKQQEAAARAEMRQKENERFLELKSKMDTVNAEMMGKMGTKMLEMSDQMFDRMQLPPGRIVDADDDDDGRNVRRLRR
ncbi:hypothetical protein [Ktedonospora formicarum]|uniref:Uncharacterized protein n=1 Tax=Ktedonospora formicarum TaxID=2778364 RepID=A0A8J3IER8_9CHLR|nr:hypothetical protein [Ktedonospora formicarum]GHO51427.1 hypothetical protein KSX_95900 [Ktedonospora formicarum]